MTEAVQTMESIHMVGSIMVVGAQTCYTLIHFMCDLKAIQMNVQCSLIQEFMLYEFKLDHNAAEATKNICDVKDKSVVDYSKVNK